MIADDAIRALQIANRESTRVSQLTVPHDATVPAWRLMIETDCGLALGEIPDSPALSEHANRSTQAAARARCATIVAKLATYPGKLP